MLCVVRASIWLIMLKTRFDYIESPVNRSISLKEDFITIRNICKFIKKKILI